MKILQRTGSDNGCYYASCSGQDTAEKLDHFRKCFHTVTSATPTEKRIHSVQAVNSQQMMKLHTAEGKEDMYLGAKVRRRRKKVKDYSVSCTSVSCSHYQSEDTLPPTVNEGIFARIAMLATLRDEGYIEKREYER